MAVLAEPTLREELHGATLTSGLPVYVLPRGGVVRKFATFAVHYGSVDNQFVVPGEGQATSVPDGIAHFLEHKLFEEKEGNVFDRFAALGADCNAYTYYTTTTYLFDCTDNFEPALDILVDFVQDPYFTEENVAKEKGIIQQELRMYNDSPGWRVRANLMKGLYHVHPVRIDIGGTVESIQRIDRETLYRCYRTFYHPSNMALFVVGDVDPDRVIERVAGRMAKRKLAPQPPIERIFSPEPTGVRQQRTEEKMVVAQPILRIGFKDSDLGLTGPDQLRKELISELVLDVFLGRGSSLYQELYEDGLVSDRFELGFEGGRRSGSNGKA
ncbi:MAG: insulinase family protein, partial [Firmicutes bacterium]|nr:insulinase family protein [Bacillota bacterium]